MAAVEVEVAYEPRKARDQRIPLIEGTQMRCPRCRRLFNILQYQRLEIPVQFELELTPIYKCPRHVTNQDGEHGCGYLFAPADDTATNGAVRGAVTS